jgi:DNA-binding MarR family transcriptional regulator
LSQLWVKFVIKIFPQILTASACLPKIYFFNEIFVGEMFYGDKDLERNSQALAEEVIHKFLRLNRLLRQYARQMDSQGIRPRQLAVLRFLLAAGPATVGQVQAYLYLSASTTSMVISQLEEAGYATRTRSEEDNRVVMVELTPAGREIAQHTPLGGIALLRRRLGNLPDERLRLLDEALAEIMGLMEVPDTDE